jgi:3-oxoadipate enol-lactonase
VSGEKSEIVEINGARIYCEITGFGQHIVLIHPQGLDRRIWDAQISAFSERYRVVRYDRRYHGLTRDEDEAHATSDVSTLDNLGQWLEDQPPSPASYEDLRDVLDGLKIERAHLLGLRDGGEVALDFSLEYPEKVGALILVDTVIASSASSQQQQRMVERGAEKATELEEAIEEALKTKDPTAIIDWTLEDPSYANSTEATLQKLREIYADNAPSLLFPRGYNTRRLDPPAGSRLDEIEVPTLLILTGERGPDVGEFDEALITGIARSAKVTVPDAFPTLNMDRPEEFNRIVLVFLEGL